MFGWPSFCLACFLSCSTAAHRVYGCFHQEKQVLAILYCWIAFIKESKCWPYCTIELFSWRKASVGHTVPLNCFHQGKQMLAILRRWIAFIKESKCLPYCAVELLSSRKASVGHLRKASVGHTVPDHVRAIELLSSRKASVGHTVLLGCFRWGKQVLILLCYPTASIEESKHWPYCAADTCFHWVKQLVTYSI